MKALALKLFGVLLMLGAIALALSRAPDRPVESLVARWAPAPSEFAAVRGQLVHLRDVGPRDDPLPVVLVHGTSSSLHTWEGWAGALQSRRRVITFDLPGFGLSGPFTGQYTPGDYRGDTYARFVLDLMDHLRVARFVIGGNSLGGEVAWRVAALAPARVDRLLLVDAAGLDYRPSSLPIGWLVARLPLLDRLSEYVLPRSLVAQGLASAYGDPQRVSAELVDRYYELTLREGNRRALAQRLRQWQPGADVDRLEALKLPTLIVWGGRDRLVPPAAGREFARRIAGSRLVLFDDLGHVPQEEDAARTVVAVQAFLGWPAAAAH
jgi:pimeloyl-ACP methyl ester carboxylesterase